MYTWKSQVVTQFSRSMMYSKSLHNTMFSVLHADCHYFMSYCALVVTCVCNIHVHDMYIMCISISLQASGEAQYTSDIPPLPNELAAAFILTTQV